MFRSFAAAALLTACSSPRVCTPGETRLCAGPNNCSGMRTCDASGIALGECTCGAGGGSGTAGGSSGGSAGGAAGGTAGGAPPDAGPRDAGCPLPCGGGCCRYKQLCGADGGCYSDFDVDRRPYCEPCSNGGSINTCGTGSNFCLVDGTRAFCGADCSQGQECPAGYACRDIRVVFTRWACSASNPACQPNPSLPCQGPQDCPRGGTCTGNACAGVCTAGPGDPQGFCSCLVDSDCAQQSCTGGECSISRGSCVTAQDCRPIRCVDMPTPDGGRIGACLIGQNCAPAPGLTCAEVG